MMKLHVLSDVHLEFGHWPKDVDVNAIDADVICGSMATRTL